MFGVCEALVRDELRWLESSTVAAPAINDLWADLSDHERDAFVREYLADLWDRIDSVTR